jgi:primary-amine oxidase
VIVLSNLAGVAVSFFYLFIARLTAADGFRRAQLLEHTLWVTPFSPDERWPSGEFVNQSAEDEGLPAWTAVDRPIDDTDLVLW